MRARSLGLGSTELIRGRGKLVEIDIYTGVTIAGSGYGYINVYVPTDSGNDSIYISYVQENMTPSEVAFASTFANMPQYVIDELKVKGVVDIRSKGSTLQIEYSRNSNPIISTNSGIPASDNGVTGALGSEVRVLGEVPESTDLYGYYGKYQGIITPNELISLAGITQGTTKNDAYNNPNEDITWLKFSHNYKTLFVADRTIHYGVSWNHLDEKGVVFGKVVDIDGQKYLLRLLQGANVNPANVSGGANSNDEWDSLIVQFTPNTEDSHWSSSDNVNKSSGFNYTICQETGSAHIDHIALRGNSYVDFFYSSYTFNSKSDTHSSKGYRPVLEVL